MEAKDIWRNIKLNQFDSLFDIDYFYYDLMKKVKKCLKNYEAICYKTFSFEDKTEEEMKLIQLEFSKKLTEENYVYKIYIDKKNIEIILYLLNISEMQYKEIEKKREEIYLGKWKEFFLSEIFLLPLVLSYIMLEVVFLLIIFFVFGFIPVFWIFIANFIFITFIFNVNLDKKRNHLRKQKANLVNKFNKYLLNLNRNFCDENSNLEEIEELHQIYYKYPNWNEYLQYL